MYGVKTLLISAENNSVYFFHSLISQDSLASLARFTCALSGEKI